MISRLFSFVLLFHLAISEPGNPPRPTAAPGPDPGGCDSDAACLVDCFPIGTCTCDTSSGTGICRCNDGEACPGGNCALCGDCSLNLDCRCDDTTDCRCLDGNCLCNVGDLPCTGNDCNGCDPTPEDFDCVQDDECGECEGGGCICTPANNCVCRDGLDCLFDVCSNCAGADALAIDGIRVDIKRMDFDRGLAAAWEYKATRVGAYQFMNWEIGLDGDLMNIDFMCNVEWIWEIGNLSGDDTKKDVSLLSYLQLLGSSEPGKLGGNGGSVVGAAAEGGVTSGQANIVTTGSAADLVAGAQGSNVGISDNDSPPPPKSPAPPTSPAPPPIVLPEFFVVEICTELDFTVTTPTGAWTGTGRFESTVRCDLVPRTSVLANIPDVIFDAICTEQATILDVCTADVVEKKDISLLASAAEAIDGAATSNLGQTDNEPSTPTTPKTDVETTIIDTDIDDTDTTDADPVTQNCIEIDDDVDAALNGVSGSTNMVGGSTEWPENGFGRVDPDPPSLSPAPPPSPGAKAGSDNINNAASANIGGSKASGPLMF